MQQRTTEWIEKVNMEYHERQFREPYRSTVAFCDWLEASGYLSSESEASILDVASGLGANLHYMGRRFPKCRFLGVDFNAEIVARGNAFFQANGIANCRMEVGDLYHLDEAFVSAFDGATFLQTLSWLPEYQEPLRAIAGLGAGWIAMSSLFYDGPIACTIEAHIHDADHVPSRDSYYNVYSLPVVSRFLEGLGYGPTQARPFEIDIDLAPPADRGLGTHTETLASGRRLQISGPLLMPWHFVGARRI